MPRFNDWLRRIAFPETTNVGLGFFAETWRADFSTHPAFEWYEQQGRDLGRSIDATHYITRNLLGDVIHAAGAVEYAVGRIDSLLAEAQHWVDENIELPSEDQWPSHRAGFSFDTVTQAGWELGNLVAWARAVDERMQRNDGRHKNGVFPLLADDHPARATIEQLVEDLHVALEDARRLAGYMLHHASIPYPGHGAELRRDGRVVWQLPDPFPDPAAQRIYTFDQLSFEQGRDLETFAHELWHTVEAFVDALLDALEHGQVELERRRHA